MSRRPPRSAFVAALLLLVAAPMLVGCGASGPGDLGAPSRSTPPDGSGLVTCDLTTGDGTLAFLFVLADDYVPEPEPGGSGCVWRRPGSPRVEESVVRVEWIGEAESLGEVRDRQEPFVAEDGDDALSDLRLSEDVAVFGETVGDRLRWDCACDGLPSATYLSQAAGVRLTWSGPVVLQDQIEDEVRTALASAGAG